MKTFSSLFKRHFWEIFTAVILGLLSFLSASSVAFAATGTDLDQCQNGNLLNFSIPCENSSTPIWANGSLNGSNSQYREGDGLPYRLDVTGLTDGNWIIRIQYDFSQGGVFALDRLTSYNLTQNSNPCSGHPASLCDGSFPQAFIPIPGEVSFPTATTPPLPKGGALMIAGITRTLTANDTRMAVWERTDTGTVSLVRVDPYVTQIGPASGNSTRDFGFTIRVAGCPANGCSVVFGWTGHVAAEWDWGAGKGASSISGAPFHMRVLGVDQIDGTGGGNQDRSVQAGAIVPLPGAGVSCSNFSSASYRVTNNGGGLSFLVNTPIETGLELNVKDIGDTDAGNSDIVLALDRSSSMNDTETSTSAETKLQAAKIALSAAVDMIASKRDLNNRIALVTFSDNVTLDQPLTNNYNAVKVAINNITAGGGTSIGGGLFGAASELKNNSTNPAIRKFIILASDGVQDTAPSIGTGIAAVPSDVTVYTVGIGADADAASLRTIAQTAGAANGEYFFSTSSTIAGIFENIAGRILNAFSLYNVKLVFTRDDVSRTALTGTLPAYSSYDGTNGILRWNSLGSMSNGEKKNISIHYEGKSVGRDIPLNTYSVLVAYDISGTACSETIPVNVLFVNVTDTEDTSGDDGTDPSCINTTWTPSADTICTTQTFTQISNCGESRSLSGTKICTQCSDGIDNDHDGYIDYPSDRGCYSLLDDNEKDYIFYFFEF